VGIYNGRNPFMLTFQFPSEYSLIECSDRDKYFWVKRILLEMKRETCSRLKNRFMETEGKPLWSSFGEKS
jgi:hypothetical protein